MMIDTCVRLNLQIFQGGHSGIVCGLSLPRIVTFLSNLWGRRDIPGDGGSGGMSSSLLRSCVTHQGAGDDDGDSHPTPLTCPTPNLLFNVSTDILIHKHLRSDTYKNDHKS